MMRFLPRLSPLLLLLLLSPSSNHAQQLPNYEGDPNFLMIGNSYTAPMQSTFTSILLSAFPEWTDTLYYRQVTPGGTTLGGHWSNTQNGGPLNGLLVSENAPAWKWVTLQDQSQVPGFVQWDWEGTDFHRSFTAARAFREYVDALGGHTVFFMTWGRRNGDGRNPDLYPDFTTMQNLLTQGYMRYVEETSTPENPTYVAPVGLVFKTIHDDLVAQGITPTDDGTLFVSLYSGDGSHQSGIGTYVAALTIFTTQFGLDPESMEYYPSNIDEETARALQDAISRTILETFETGFITYPWTVSWTGSTLGSVTLPEEEPTTTTNTPTRAPTPDPTPEPTTPPTLLPTPQPTVITTPPPPPPYHTGTPYPEEETTQQNNNNTKGSLTIHIQYDKYPQDIAWTFFGGGDYQVNYFQPYNTVASPFYDQATVFTYLDQNETYDFKISDQHGDGLCCDHGEGFVEIVDHNNNNGVLFELGYALGAYYEIDIAIGSNGQAEVVHKSTGYAPSTWPDLEVEIWEPSNNNNTTTITWPGEFPSQNETFRLVVNSVDLEVSWALRRGANGDPDNDWNLLGAWNGSTAPAGSWNATEFSNLQPGWYQVVVNNGPLVLKAKDNDNNGYMTLTGPLTATQELGVVWGSDGEFGEQVTVDFRMDNDGYVSQVQWDIAKDVRPPGLSECTPTGEESCPVADCAPPPEGCDYILDHYITDDAGVCCASLCYAVDSEGVLCNGDEQQKEEECTPTGEEICPVADCSAPPAGCDYIDYHYVINFADLCCPSLCYAVDGNGDQCSWDDEPGEGDECAPTGSETCPVADCSAPPEGCDYIDYHYVINFAGDCCPSLCYAVDSNGDKCNWDIFDQGEEATIEETECTQTGNEFYCPVAKCGAPPNGCDYIFDHYVTNVDGVCCPSLCYAVDSNGAHCENDPPSEIERIKATAKPTAPPQQPPAFEGSVVSGTSEWVGLEGAIASSAWKMSLAECLMLGALLSSMILL